MKKLLIMSLVLVLVLASSALPAFAVDEYGLGATDPEADIAIPVFNSGDGKYYVDANKDGKYDTGDAVEATADNVKNFHASTELTPSEASGGTTVGVMALKDSQVSFTVPLYVTLAVVGNNTTGGDVYAPAAASYKITNTSPNATIAVTGVKATKTGAWDLVLGTPAAGSATKMGLTLAGLELSTDATVLTTFDATPNSLHKVSKALNEYKLGDLIATTATNNEFVADATKNWFMPILKTASKGMQFAGTVASNWASVGVDQAAAPQWTIEYTLSQCDINGALLTAFTYSGNTLNYVWDGTEFTTQGAFAKTN